MDCHPVAQEEMKYVILFIICAVLLFPVWLMVMNGFTPAKMFLRMPPRLIPYEFTLDNYKQALTIPYLGRWIVNTGILLAIIVTSGVLINGAAGYVFAFAKFPGKQLIFWSMLTPIFVTRFSLLISQFVIVGALHLNGLWAVVAMSIFWPSGIFLFRNYFSSLPISIIESARMDGASEWTILRKVVLPVCKPIVGMSVVFIGMGVLGDYIWQMLNLQTDDVKTYLVGLMNTTMDFYTAKSIGYNLAVGTLLFIPYLLLFAFSSKYFIEGLTGGASKE
jgi:ABC-type glycerol-3-phosphate transport system permease component